MKLTTKLKNKALDIGKEKLNNVLKNDTPSEQLTLVNEQQIVTWYEFYKNIYKLKRENKSYHKSDDELIAGLNGKNYYAVYKFSRHRYNVQLVPEPTNEHDKNAIKVLFDGLHVGYIPRDLTNQYRSVIDNANALFYGDIRGGAYKLVRPEYVEDKLDEFTLTLKLRK